MASSTPRRFPALVLQAFPVSKEPLSRLLLFDFIYEFKKKFFESCKGFTNGDIDYPPDKYDECYCDNFVWDIFFSCCEVDNIAYHKRDKQHSYWIPVFQANSLPLITVYPTF